MSFRPAGVPHQDEVGPGGARMFGIEIERTRQRSLADCSGNLGIAYDSEGGELALARPLNSMRKPARRSTSHEFQVESLVSELLGAVACKPERCTTAPFWMRRIHEKLNAEFRQRLTMDDLAREAGVHPVHLSRVFRRVIGMGIGEYVHRLRIREACERMIQAQKPRSPKSVATSALPTRATSPAPFTASPEPVPPPFESESSWGTRAGCWINTC